MLNFYPGPSKLYAGIDLHIQKAIASGILSMNHRSADFMALYKQVQDGFEMYYDLPKGYSVYFTSSATECWTILAESFLTDPSYTSTMDRLEKNGWRFRNN